MYILGISAYYHDSAAALIKEGKIIAAAQEERFTRKKHDSEFPSQSVLYCLQEAGISLSEVECVVFYDKPIQKFERLLETYLHFAPSGLQSYLKAIPVWVKDKLFLKRNIRKALAEIGKLKVSEVPKLMFTEHHQSHAASAFFPSPFQHAAVMCLDGVGEWATTTVWKGDGNKLDPLWHIDFPHSLGMLYSAFTYYTGFKVNSGEYKLMGLAPYGEPKYVDKILNNLIDLKSDGTFHLNMEYFNFAVGLTMTNKKFDQLFGRPARTGETEITQMDMDLARSVQVVTEEVVMRLARTVQKETGEDSLCLAGGVALNCVANGKLLREGPFKNIWIQPAAGDAGGALGAALAVWHEYYQKPRTAHADDSMLGSYLGPGLKEENIRAYLDSIGATYEKLDRQTLNEKVAKLLAEESVVGWVTGRMEFGPRALGRRSILGDPRSQKMQSIMNLKIKYRESFRPFAPAVLWEDVESYFELKEKSPYMLICAPIQPNIRVDSSQKEAGLFGIEKLKVPRSKLPAITHVDYSARVQTVDQNTNPEFHSLLNEFKKQTGCSVLVNTSFNVRGEPIVCDEKDAYRCFMRTEMDYLVIDNFLLEKTVQQPHVNIFDQLSNFALD